MSYFSRRNPKTQVRISPIPQAITRKMPSVRAPGSSKKEIYLISGPGVGVIVIVGVGESSGASVGVIVEVGRGVLVDGGGVTVGVSVSATGVPP